ncbi:MAG: hypothetical protein GXP45_05965 [bacterium]|nr:hypothetical protein [bacterium]
MYNALYHYLQDLQDLYQNDLNRFVMDYAQAKQSQSFSDALFSLNNDLDDITLKLSNYDNQFQKELNHFIARYEGKK